MSKTTSHIFIFISAKNCPHCTSFRNNQWPTCKTQIEQLNTVKSIEIELDKIGDTNKLNDYPNDLKKYVKWYPIFILVPAQSWFNSVSDIKQPLQNMKIYNGIYDSVKDIYKHKEAQQSQPINATSIVSWISNEIKSANNTNNVNINNTSLLSNNETKTSEPIELIPTSVCRQMFRPKNR